MACGVSSDGEGVSGVCECAVEMGPIRSHIGCRRDIIRSSDIGPRFTDPTAAYWYIPRCTPLHVQTSSGWNGVPLTFAAVGNYIV